MGLPEDYENDNLWDENVVNFWAAEINDKVNKLVGTNLLYGTTWDTGADTGIGFSTAPFPWTVPQRLGAGELTVPTTPTEDTHAASKAYVDAALLGDVDGGNAFSTYGGVPAIDGGTA